MQTCYLKNGKKKKTQKILALIHPRYFSHSHIIMTVDTDSQESCSCYHSCALSRWRLTKCVFGKLSLWNECNSRRSTCFLTSRLLCSRYRTKAPFFSPKPHVQPQRLQPRFLSSLLRAHVHFDCFLLVSATTDYVFANSCHTIMYYSVFRFVYAHFIVAIIDSCCMDEKNLNKTIFDLLMQHLCVVIASAWTVWVEFGHRSWDIHSFIFNMCVDALLLKNVWQLDVQRHISHHRFWTSASRTIIVTLRVQSQRDWSSSTETDVWQMCSGRLSWDWVHNLG